MKFPSTYNAAVVSANHVTTFSYAERSLYTTEKVIIPKCTQEYIIAMPNRNAINSILFDFYHSVNNLIPPPSLTVQTIILPWGDLYIPAFLVPVVIIHTGPTQELLALFVHSI